MRVLYMQDRRTRETRPFLTLHDDGSLTTDDPQMARAIPRMRKNHGWSNEYIFGFWKTKGNAYVRYFEAAE
ncbi:hypothetical protein ACFPZ0_03085 [Streptomonospora nanhaiensis]|uniref:Uncharacterized protein n=1 Tax=Streptomonospora nanhaiensis TaxID=1323731 RepID=A0A853BTY3_9ACTN|nr:hypothetical protein [Streptomonospora nanhaiensis]MBX9388385.1 hypothetical protein [Streptomonospora nanhaiensis]NYI98450.1 hypothetical protein [Streptomonospora nanhaiensis]